MARRDHAGVAPAGPGRDLAVALDDHDLVAVALQLIGGGDADAAAAEHDYAHGGLAWAARQAACRHRSADIDVRRSFIAQTRPRRRCGVRRPPRRGLSDQSITARANKQSGQSRPVDALGAIPTL